MFKFKASIYQTHSLNPFFLALKKAAEVDLPGAKKFQEEYGSPEAQVKALYIDFFFISLLNQATDLLFSDASTFVEQRTMYLKSLSIPNEAPTVTRSLTSSWCVIQ